MKKKSCSTNSIKKECCCPCKSKWTLLVLGILVIAVAAYFGFTRTKGLSGFKYQTEQFGDVRILRYQVPEFDKLSPKEKELAYYLYEASLAGRDMIYDQNYKHNLTIRKTLEEIVKHYAGDRKTDDFKKFLDYTKMVWISNGIHHHQSTEKMIPQFSQDYFATLVQGSPQANFPLKKNENLTSFVQWLTPIIFDPAVDPKRVNQDEGTDLVAGSANNFYEGVTQAEAQAYYDKIVDRSDPTPISYGLNSKLMKINGTIVEIPWKIGGLYSAAIEKIVFWLNKATAVAENDQQREVLKKLIQFYQTGDLRLFDHYSIDWLKCSSRLELTQGFIEVYGDALGRKGSYQSSLTQHDEEATLRSKKIADQAQWFEDHLPVRPDYKKKSAKGVEGRVVNHILSAGDMAPWVPLGQNLPNSEWIRKDYGSKSTSFANIATAYDESMRESGVLEEFSYSEDLVKQAKKYGLISDLVMTDLHEIIGHGSGQLKAGQPDPSVTLKNYYNPLEEARADLVALYFILDPKLVELKIFQSQEAGKVAYDDYITNGLMRQLARLDLGKTIEAAHMRSRHLIAKWVFDHGQKDRILEKKMKDGKTYIVVNDFEKMRELIGKLLADVQRIKSEGDYESAKNLIETYAVVPDPLLHKEVKERWAKLNIAPNGRFIQAKLVPVMKNEKVVDVKIEYPDDFTEQMMEYGEKYSFLPVYN